MSIRMERVPSRAESSSGGCARGTTIRVLFFPCFFFFFRVIISVAENAKTKDQKTMGEV